MTTMLISSAAILERSSIAHVERGKVWAAPRGRLWDVPNPREIESGGATACSRNAPEEMVRMNRERELGLDRRETG